MPYIEIENRVYNGPKYMDLGAPSGVVWESRFDLLPLSTTTNATELRSLLAASGLTLTRASAATVQTSSSSLVTSGIGVDDPRVGDGGYGRGLVVERLAQNILPRSDPAAAGWANGNLTAAAPTTGSGATGPDGGTSQSLAFPAVTAGYSVRYGSSASFTAAAWTMSAWLRGVSGGEMPYFMFTPNGVAYTNTQPTLTTAWSRVAFAATALAGGGYVQLGTDKRDASQNNTSAQTINAALVQAELGAFATEMIVTSGAAATRQSDRVLLDSAARIVRGGRATLNARMALKGSIGGSNDYAADPYLWRYDGSNYATINRTTGAITIVIAGASYTTASGFTAARGDVVDYWVEAGGGSLQSVVKARKSSDGGTTWGTVTTLGTSGAPQGTIPSAGPLDLLSNAGTAGHLSCWLQRFRAYGAGRRIAWAA